MDELAPLRERLFPYRGDTPRDEGDPARHLDDYDKILVEREVLGDSQLAGTVLRLPVVYGPGDYQHRLHPYLKRMDDGRSAILLERRAAAWRLSRGYVENVAEAVVLAAAHPAAAGRVYNVCEPRARTEAEWVAAIAETAGWLGRIVIAHRDELPASLAGDAGTDHHLECDTTRLRGELGYREVISPEAGLRRTLDWERLHPPAKFDERSFDYDAEDTVLANGSLAPSRSPGRS
jgi:nucleoside-diphosphate-sugar epimerase